MISSTLGLLQKTLALYKKNFNLFLKHTLVIVVSIMITSLIRSFILQSYLKTGTLPPLPIVLGMIGIILLLSFVTLWGTVTLIRIIGQSSTGKPVDSFFKEIFLSFPMLFSVLWVIILFSLCVFAGLLLFFIPAVVFSLWFFFSIYARIFDNQKGTNALRFSKKLVEQDWAKILWIIVSTFLLIFGTLNLGETMTEFIFTFLSQIMGSPLFAIFGVLINLIANILFAPMYIIAFTLLYLELKALKSV